MADEWEKGALDARAEEMRQDNILVDWKGTRSLRGEIFQRRQAKSRGNQGPTPERQGKAKAKGKLKSRRFHLLTSGLDVGS